MTFILLFFSILTFTQEEIEQQGSGSACSGQEIVRDARVVGFEDALKLHNEKTNELIKLSRIYVEQTDPKIAGNESTNGTASHSIAYTHAITFDRERKDSHPALTLMAKGFNQKTGKLFDPFGTSFSAFAVYMKQFPSVEDIKNYSTIEEFENSFGPVRGRVGGWESDGVLHYTNSWLVFRVNTDGHIVRMAVSAKMKKNTASGAVSVGTIAVSEKTFLPVPVSIPDLPAENAK